MSHITIIAAVARDGAIGRAGDLAFHISADLKHFKALTSGHTVVMGRKTFQSLPKGALPDRRNIVITRDSSFSAPGIEIAGSIAEAMDMAAGEEIFIIGGGEIYRQTLPLAARLEITHIDAACPGADTFFPEIAPADWSVDATPAATDERTGLPYRFATYTRACKDETPH